jgi:hypothetical protein
MFWKTAEYPEFVLMPKGEQMRIVKLAMRHRAKLVTLRSLGVLVLLFSAALALKLGSDRSHADPVFYWMTSPVFGLLLYAYLIWEINGPLHRAVQSCLEAKP